MEWRVNGLGLSSYLDVAPSSMVNNHLRVRGTASSQNSMKERGKQSLVDCKDCGSHVRTSRRFLGASNRDFERNLADGHDSEHDLLSQTTSSVSHAPVLQSASFHVEGPTVTTPTDRVQHTIMTMRRPPASSATIHEGSSSVQIHSYRPTRHGKVKADNFAENESDKNINDQQTQPSTSVSLPRQFNGRGAQIGSAQFRHAFVTSPDGIIHSRGPHPSRYFPDGGRIPRVSRYHQGVASLQLDPSNSTPSVKKMMSSHIYSFLTMAPGGTGSSITSATHPQPSGRESISLDEITSMSHPLDVQHADPSNDFLSLSLGSSHHETQRKNKL